MIELRGMVDFYKGYNKLKQFPIAIQEQIRDALKTLDESYGEPNNRELEGGKVILLENQGEIKQLHNQYDLSMNEYVDEINTCTGIYLIVLVIFGTENNIIILGKGEWIRPYLGT